MANTPKKRLEKTVDDSPMTNRNSQKFYCCRCGTAYSRQKGYFPVSHSPMYRGSGYLPMCNDCIEELYEYYHSILSSDAEAMRRICMKLDLYWSQKIYDMVERTSGTHSRVRSYIGKTNLIRFIDKTFDDSLKEESENESQPSNSFTFVNTDNEIEEPVIEVAQEITDFWGTGFTPDFYDELERRYKEWTNGASVDDPGKRALYKQICILEATINRDTANGKSIDKSVNALNTLLGSMNLKPAQKKEEVDADLEKMPLGVGIAKWEYSRPLPVNPDELKDTHNIVKNITTWFLGHVCKMVGLRNGYCKMYEDAMDELRVKNPEYDEEDDDTLLNDIFGGASPGGDTQ